MNNELIQMDVTKEERKAILATRVQETLKKRHTKYTLKLLDLAAKYACWMKEEGVDNTFQAFCNDFGYLGLAEEAEKRGGIPMTHTRLSIAHKAVSDIILMAFNTVTAGTQFYSFSEKEFERRKEIMQECSSRVCKICP